MKIAARAEKEKNNLGGENAESSLLKVQLKMWKCQWKFCLTFLTSCLLVCDPAKCDDDDKETTTMTTATTQTTTAVVELQPVASMPSPSKQISAQAGK
jgi:hypothetical protein